MQASTRLLTPSLASCSGRTRPTGSCRKRNLPAALPLHDMMHSLPHDLPSSLMTLDIALRDLTELNPSVAGMESFLRDVTVLADSAAPAQAGPSQLGGEALKPLADLLETTLKTIQGQVQKVRCGNRDTSGCRDGFALGVTHHLSAQSVAAPVECHGRLPLVKMALFVKFSISPTTWLFFQRAWIWLCNADVSTLLGCHSWEFLHRNGFHLFVAAWRAIFIRMVDHIFGTARESTDAPPHHPASQVTAGDARAQAAGKGLIYI